jgi:diguanylate cyclase (GGDEF)-like protein/PAS domain S-box-containing protein
MPQSMPYFQDPEICRDILNHLLIGISVLDLHQKIVFWSEGAEQITGYARIDVLGHSCTENILLHCDQSSCESCAGKCPMAAALHDGKAVEAMSLIHHRSGHWAPVHTWAIPLRDEHGSIVAIIQTFEPEFAVRSSSPKDRSRMERGYLDYATELPNHDMTQSHLRETLQIFAELQIPFGLICLEVQKLSQFRARYGQEAGTLILRVLGRTLRNTIWPTDFVGRWTEDRFLVILSGCDDEALCAVKARILRMTMHATIEWWGEELTVAVVVGSTAGVKGDSNESVLQRIQEALQRQSVAPSGHAVLAAGDPSSTG